MKIQPNEPLQTPTQAARTGAPASGAASVQRRESAPAASASTAPAREPAVRVELSGRARELHAALAAAQAAPDIRADKVAEVKARVDAGTYSVDASVVARRMLDIRA